MKNVLVNNSKVIVEYYILFYPMFGWREHKKNKEKKIHK